MSVARVVPLLFAIALLAIPLERAHASGGSPALRSASVLITDGSGRLVYSKDADQARPIASITKLMTAMVILDADLDPEQEITITRNDRDLIQLTGSRLAYGAVLTRRELLVLALMASENRAANALGRTYPGGMKALVQAMNRKAADLGMSNSVFRDPAGLDPGNVSTAADLLKMLNAVEEYPLIRAATTTASRKVHPYPDRGPLRYVNTNRLLKNNAWEIQLSKTGYLNEAGRCLVMQARVDDRDLSVILLDSFGKLTPFGDANRLRRWLREQGPESYLAARETGTGSPD